MLQDDHPDFVAVGDQKTGVVGEYYGLLYARSLYPDAKVAYAPDPSQAGWDIGVDRGVRGSNLKIQVKTVSAYSRSRSVTPLSPGWDHLYMLYLSRSLQPEGFWIIETADIFKGKLCLTGLSMRRPDSSTVALLEALLIYAHQPAYNAKGLARPPAGKHVRIFNTGKHAPLLPEVSTRRWADVRRPSSQEDGSR